MFAHPLGLFALLAIPAIVGLHLFRRRFRPREVSALFLWRDLDPTPLAGRRREPLKQTASLWLECLAALALALALAGPRGGEARAEHLVVLLDDSASMSAVVDGRTIESRAKELVAERMRALPAHSRVSLVLTGARPRLAAGPAAFVHEALERLESWQPRAPRHDFESALALAAELAGDARVWWVTDRFEPERWPATVEITALGSSAENLAFTHALRTRERRGAEPVERVFLSVSNLGAQARATRVELLAEDRVLHSRALELAGRERKSLSFELPDVSPTIEARLTDGGALALDDRVWLVPTAPRSLNLSSTLTAEDERALGLSDPRRADVRAARWLDLVPDSRWVDDPTQAHLLLGREVAGGSATWVCLFEAGSGERRDWIGPFLIEKRHRLVEGLTLEGVIWSAESERVLDGAPVVSAQNQALLTEERRGARHVVHFNLDPARSTLARSPDWPILLSNLAEQRRSARPGPARTALAVGDSFVWRSSADEEAGAEPFQLIGPRPRDERRELLARTEVESDALFEAGVYSFERGGAKLCDLSVNFLDPSESDLVGLGNGQRPAEAPVREIGQDVSWPEVALALTALLLMLADVGVLARLYGRFSRVAPRPRFAS